MTGTADPSVSVDVLRALVGARCELWNGTRSKQLGDLLARTALKRELFQIS